MKAAVHEFGEPLRLEDRPKSRTEPDGIMLDTPPLVHDRRLDPQEC
jgi:hypothetical protein